MNWFDFSLIFFVVVVTLVAGYVIFMQFFPKDNFELRVGRYFTDQEFKVVEEMTADIPLLQKKRSLDLYLWAAQARIQLGKKSDALIYFTMAMNTLDMTILDKIFIKVEIGLIHEQMGGLKEAELSYREACALGNDDRARHGLASVLYLKQDFKMARIILRDLLKDNVNLVESRRLYAECLAELHQFHHAIKHYALLERAGLELFTYNYLRTLMDLKIWDKAEIACANLLENQANPYREEMMLNLCTIYMETKQYTECLDFIDAYYDRIHSARIRFDMDYLRATVLYMKGDEIRALAEYRRLHKEDPLYKDLEQILAKEGRYLEYPFLAHYFTADNMVFEETVTKLGSIKQLILRRSSEYYLVEIGSVAHLFYRHIKQFPSSMINEIEQKIQALCPRIEQLKIWTLNGIGGKYAVTTHSYSTETIFGDFFIKLLQDKIQEVGFVSGIPDALYAVMKKPESELLLDEILDKEIPDEWLDKSL